MSQRRENKTRRRAHCTHKFHTRPLPTVNGEMRSLRPTTRCRLKKQDEVGGQSDGRHAEAALGPTGLDGGSIGAELMHASLPSVSASHRHWKVAAYLRACLQLARACASNPAESSSGMLLHPSRQLPSHVTT